MIPNYPYDDDSYHYVEIFDLLTKSKNQLYLNDNTTDVWLHDFIDGYMIIGRENVNSMDDWGNVEKYQHDYIIQKVN